MEKTVLTRHFSCLEQTLLYNPSVTFWYQYYIKQSKVHLSIIETITQSYLFSHNVQYQKAYTVFQRESVQLQKSNLKTWLIVRELARRWRFRIFLMRKSSASWLMCSFCVIPQTRLKHIFAYLLPSHIFFWRRLFPFFVYIGVCSHWFLPYNQFLMSVVKVSWPPI